MAGETPSTAHSEMASLYGAVLDAVEVAAVVVAADGRLLLANPAWRKRLGNPTESAWDWLQPLVRQDRARAQRLLSLAMRSERHAEFDVEAMTVDGERLSLDCIASPFTPPSASAPVLIVMSWDVTERKRHAERLAFMAGHDPLTGLANRRAFEEALDRAASRVKRGQESAVLLLDMDRLKEFNDVRGHLDGDQALTNLAMLLRHHIRVSDIPARIGGDEFAVLCEDATVSEATDIAERIRVAAATEEFAPGAREVGLSVSCGVAGLEPGVESRVALDRADSALYAAKSQGRDRVVVWEPGLGTVDVGDRVRPHIREAFADDNFYLVFQPVVRLSDGAVAYYESFIRMRTPDGVSGPGEFLPAVERMGLMPRLTRRVVDLALWQLALTPGASVSVNLSASDLSDDTLLEDVHSAIQGAPTARGRLLFEVAEGMLLANPAGGRVWMERLGERGCRFVLDQFGTGLGMLVLLKEPYVEHVKLSRVIVKALTGEAGNQRFVEAMRDLIETQGKVAVAAYVETEELLGDVIRAGFRFGQGFTLHEPLADLGRLVAEMDEARRVVAAKGDEWRSAEE